MHADIRTRHWSLTEHTDPTTTSIRQVGTAVRPMTQMMDDGGIAIARAKVFENGFHIGTFFDDTISDKTHVAFLQTRSLLCCCCPIYSVHTYGSGNRPIKGGFSLHGCSTDCALTTI